MAQVACRSCGKRYDVRQMTPCQACGGLICPPCSQENEGNCPSCMHDMEGLSPGMLL